MGASFERTIAVKDIAPNAGYLPRTWAKLEIDRLLAEDAGQHRQRIIDLSKAMYVMTPFTSLLVLENEAMYREFKVDRGRKDHWAMYPCPEKIPTVYVPDPNQPADRNAPQFVNRKPHANVVKQTIMMRKSPEYLTDPAIGRPGLQGVEFDRGENLGITTSFGVIPVRGEPIQLGDIQPLAFASSKSSVIRHQFSFVPGLALSSELDVRRRT